MASERVGLVGKANTVARKGEVLVEVICADGGVVNAVLGALAAEEVHRPGHHWGR
jgi:hypothetical protein